VLIFASTGVTIPGEGELMSLGFGVTIPREGELMSLGFTPEYGRELVSRAAGHMSLSPSYLIRRAFYLE